MRLDRTWKHPSGTRRRKVRPPRYGAWIVVGSWIRRLGAVWIHGRSNLDGNGVIGCSLLSMELTMLEAGLEH